MQPLHRCKLKWQAYNPFCVLHCHFLLSHRTLWTTPGCLQESSFWRETQAHHLFLQLCTLQKSTQHFIREASVHPQTKLDPSLSHRPSEHWFPSCSTGYTNNNNYNYYVPDCVYLIFPTTLWERVCGFMGMECNNSHCY